MVENPTAAANTGQDSISSMVQVKLRKNTILSNIFMDVSAFASEGDKSISFPYWSNAFAVQKLSGATKGDDQEASFALDQLNLNQEAHIQWAIKKFDQARAKVPILQSAIDEATKQHAIGLDADIYEALEASVIADNTVAAGALTQGKVVDMITLANQKRIPKSERAFIFSNDSFGTLLKVDGFVDASKSNLDIVRNGQIGTLYGIPVFESDEVAAGTRYLAHKSALTYGFGSMPSLESESVITLGTGSRRWVMDQLYGVKAMQAGVLLIKQADA